MRNEMLMGRSKQQRERRDFRLDMPAAHREENGLSPAHSKYALSSHEQEKLWPETLREQGEIDEDRAESRKAAPSHDAESTRILLGHLCAELHAVRILLQTRQTQQRRKGQWNAEEVNLDGRPGRGTGIAS